MICVQERDKSSVGNISAKCLFCKISEEDIQERCEASCTRCLQEISTKDLCTRSRQELCWQDLCKASLGKISEEDIQERCEASCTRFL